MYCRCTSVWDSRLVLMFGGYIRYLYIMLVLVFSTCTFLRTSGLLAVHPKLASKILLPEFCKPDVPAVVGERAAPEVAIERWAGGTTRTSKPQNKAPDMNTWWGQMVVMVSRSRKKIQHIVLVTVITAVNRGVCSLQVNVNNKYFRGSLSP